MTKPIIQVSNLGKKYTIRHEQAERYTALRDVLAQKAKKLFSFPAHLRAHTGAAPGYEEFWALKDIDFEVQPGDRVGIIGRNGAGKSTLLKILSRITEPTTGRVELNGRVASLLEVGTGFHPELTGRENIYLNGAILGMSRAEIRSKFDEIVDFSGVEKFLDTPVKRYSSGMYVRLAFAVAAHLEPEILVVDEVLAVGDAEFQRKCISKMEKLSASHGRTILFVSHNMGTVVKLCDRALLLSTGQIVAKGKPHDVIDSYLEQHHSPSYFALKKDEETKYSICIKRVNLVNRKNQNVDQYTDKDEIIVALTLHVQKFSENMELALSLMDKNKTRVFTIQEKLKPFVNADTKESTIFITIPHSFLTPGYYSWIMAIHQPHVIAYHVLEDTCGFTVIDSGTEFAAYEGVDYGSVFAKYKINL